MAFVDDLTRLFSRGEDLVAKDAISKSWRSLPGLRLPEDTRASWRDSLPAMTSVQEPDTFLSGMRQRQQESARRMSFIDQLIEELQRGLFARNFVGPYADQSNPLYRGQVPY